MKTIRTCNQCGGPMSNSQQFCPICDRTEAEQEVQFSALYHMFVLNAALDRLRQSILRRAV
jgi:predicted amidophosphoribosyltransferase